MASTASRRVRRRSRIRSALHAARPPGRNQHDEHREYDNEYPQTNESRNRNNHMDTGACAHGDPVIVRRHPLDCTPARKRPASVSGRGRGCSGAASGLEPASAASVKSSARLHSAPQRRTLASMSDKERDGGGGLAALVLAGFVVLFMLLCGGGGTWLFIRQAEMERTEAMQVERAELLAKRAAAAERAARAAIETPAPSAPESPEPTQ